VKGRQTESGPGERNRKSIRAWLELLRLPNLFTVPGDAVAGYVLASGGQLRLWRVSLVGLAGICLYCAGLILNDLHDFADDRVWRPERPLPRGAVSRREAAVAAALFLVGGLVLAAGAGLRSLVIALVLTGSIVAYDSGLKSLPLVGVLLMGMCRLLNVMLGVAAAPFAGGLGAALAAAGLVGVYVAMVTAFARSETRSDLPQSTLWMIPLTLGVGFVLMLAFVWVQAPAAIAAFVLLWATAFGLSFLPWVLLESPLGGYLPFPLLNLLGFTERIPPPPEEAVRPRFLPERDESLVRRLKQQGVGLLLSLLILVQSALVLGRAVTAPGRAAGLVLLAGWVANRALARRISPS